MELSVQMEKTNEENYKTNQSNHEDSMDDIQQLQANLARRQRTLRQMSDDVLWLLRQKVGRYRWTGTRRDLVELVHIVWQQGVCLDEQAKALQQMELIRRVFRVVGQEAPHQISCMLRGIQNRTKPTLSMLWRYEHIDAQSPIQRFLSCH